MAIGTKKTFKIQKQISVKNVTVIIKAKKKKGSILKKGLAGGYLFH
jgi:hypothetical protein